MGCWLPGHLPSRDRGLTVEGRVPQAPDRQLRPNPASADFRCDPSKLLTLPELSFSLVGNGETLSTSLPGLL